MSDYYTESQMRRIEQAAYDGAMLEAGKAWERQRYEFGATETELAERITELEAEVTKCHELQDSYCDRIAELEEAQRWIPVSERLPEDRATILAAFKNREILTASYYEHYKGFGGVENYWHIEGWHSGNVTHWMPLPSAPESEE